MRSYSKSVLSYTDVHQAFEKAGELGSILLTFNTAQQATTWVQRANAYRVLLRNQNKDAGRDFTCAFDHLMVKRPKDRLQVLIEPRGFDFVATAPDGAPIELSRKTLSGPVETPHEESLASSEFDEFLEGLSDIDYTKGPKK